MRSLCPQKEPCTSTAKPQHSPAAKRLSSTMRCSPYEGCQAGRGFSAWCFSLGLGRARRSGREAESRAVAPRRMNHSDSELGSRLLVWVSFF